MPGQYGESTVPILLSQEGHYWNNNFFKLIISIFWLKLGHIVKYSLSPREIPLEPPSGFPSCSGYTSPYIPPLVKIQIQYVISNNRILTFYSLSITSSLRVYVAKYSLAQFLIKLQVALLLYQLLKNHIVYSSEKNKWKLEANSCCKWMLSKMYGLTKL